MPRLVPHVVDLGGGVKRQVRLPDFYDNTGSTISTAVGIERATDADRTLEFVTIDQLVRTGRAAYVSIRYGTGTAAKSSKVLCSRDKLDTVAGTILGLKYKGVDIQSAGFSRRRSRG